MTFRWIMPLFACLLPTISAQAGPVYLETTCARSGTNGYLVFCDQAVRTEITSDGMGSLIGLYLTAPPAHCMPVSYAVALPYPPIPTEEGVAYAVPSWPLAPGPHGDNHLGMTDRPLQPGETQLLPIGSGFAAGTHEILIMVMAVPEGCNTGAIQGWGVTVEQVIIPQ
jgi:hypothetical protein